MKVYIPGLGHEPTEEQRKIGIKMYSPVFTNKKLMLIYLKAEKERTGLDHITYAIANIESKIANI